MNLGFALRTCTVSGRESPCEFCFLALLFASRALFHQPFPGVMALKDASCVDLTPLLFAEDGFFGDGSFRCLEADEVESRTYGPAG